MSLYILDTDTLTLLQEGNPAVTSRYYANASNIVAVTVLTVEEQLSGWYTQVRKAKKSDRLAWAYRRLAESVSFLSHFPILVYDEIAIQRTANLRQLKVKIRTFDLRIAAVALENKAILATCNTRDFIQVPGLTIENWSL